ncbi:tapasin-related protein-like, partial [Hypanus sabinus]|uniref:tapasin-related protein-like n=1 Tax=Hypanus sabinus TaxID=79690 RepID=UPI0028C4AC92
PPRVSVFAQPSGTGPRVLLVCEASQFFPLAADFAWVVRAPGDDPEAEPVPVEPLLFGSHRRNRDGTFNLSAEVALDGWPEGDPPPLYTCLVTHPGLEAPLSVSIRPRPPADETAGYLRIIYQGVLLSALLLVAGMYLRRGNRTPSEMRPSVPGPVKTTED